MSGIAIIICPLLLGVYIGYKFRGIIESGTKSFKLLIEKGE